MAHKKAGSSSKNGRDSVGQRLGVKASDGQLVIPKRSGGRLEAGREVQAGQRRFLRQLFPLRNERGELGMGRPPNDHGAIVFDANLQRQPDQFGDALRRQMFHHLRTNDAAE